MGVVRAKRNIVKPAYLHAILNSVHAKKFFRDNAKTTTNISNLSFSTLSDFSFPLPPMDVQQQIVAELEGYQKIIDGARQVVENWKPAIPVNPAWQLVPLGDAELFEVVSGGTPKSSEESYWNGDLNWVSLADLPPSNLITEITSSERTITESGLKNSSAKMIPADSVIVSTRATIGRVAINRIPLSTNQGFKNIIVRDADRVSAEFLAYMMTGLTEQMIDLASGATFKEISKTNFEQLSVPLPPMDVQQQIVAEITEQQKAIEGNRSLMDIYSQKIRDRINAVWGT